LGLGGSLLFGAWLAGLLLLARVFAGDESAGAASRERLALVCAVAPELGAVAGGDADGMLWLGEELLGALLGALLGELLLDELLLEELLDELLGGGSLALGELGDSCLQPLMNRLSRVIARRVLPIFSPYDSNRLAPFILSRVDGLSAGHLLRVLLD